jgi:hypothetical protein
MAAGLHLPGAACTPCQMPLCACVHGHDNAPYGRACGHAACGVVCSSRCCRDDACWWPVVGSRSVDRRVNICFNVAKVDCVDLGDGCCTMGIKKVEIYAGEAPWYLIATSDDGACSRSLVAHQQAASADHANPAPGLAPAARNHRMSRCPPCRHHCRSTHPGAQITRATAR